VSHIANNSSFTRDVWTAIAPDIEAPSLQRIVKVGNATLGSEDAIVAIGYLARAYLKDPPPAQFHFIVSPMVMWIWTGGMIVFFGGLIAIWPAPSAVRRGITVRARARQARAWRGSETRVSSGPQSVSPPVVLLTVALIAFVVLIVGAPLMPARGPHGERVESSIPRRPAARGGARGRRGRA